jgi:hypothetical protein
MILRCNGIIVMEGDKPSDGTVVDVTPVGDSTPDAGNIGNHPAIGIWKDRTDLPDDPVDASRVFAATNDPAGGSSIVLKC